MEHVRQWMNEDGDISEVETTECDRCEASVRYGPFADALKAGWFERDYGYCCPNCAQIEANQAEMGGTVVGLAELGEALVTDPE